jgi:hypothetical protein
MCLCVLIQQVESLGLGKAVIFLFQKSRRPYQAGVWDIGECPFLKGFTDRYVRM